VKIPRGKEQFWREQRPIVKYSDALPGAVKTAELIKMPFGMWTWLSLRKHVLDGDTHWRHLANITESSKVADRRPYVELL